MIFLGFQDAIEYIATNKVLVILAISDCNFQIGNLVQFEIEVTLQRLGNVFADAEFAEILQVWQALSKACVLSEYPRASSRLPTPDTLSRRVCADPSP